MRATTLVKFDATHQVKYNPPLMRAVHFTANNFTITAGYYFTRRKANFTEKGLCQNDKDLFSGGDGGNRTRVRKPVTGAFYECSGSFDIPSAHRRTAGFAHQ